MARSRRDSAKLIAVLSTALSACTCTGAALAQTGGAPAPQPVAPTPGSTGYGQPGTHAIVVAPTALVGHTTYVRGTMPRKARRRVILQRRDSKGVWRNEHRGRVRSNERFLIRWRAKLTGRVSLRVVVLRRDGRAARPTNAPIALVNVYRPARATLFGPGLYGNKTACGQVLTPLLYGVAHKNLKCATLVAILYKGREVIVPVVDRGPFHAGYSWDLTQATADALAFTGANEIGYARIRPAR